MKINDAAGTEHHKSLKVLAFVGMCVFFFLFHIWFRTRVVTKGYEVAKMRSEISALESETSSLKVEKNRLKSPAALARISEQKDSGEDALKAPEPKQIFFVQPNGL